MLYQGTSCDHQFFFIWSKVEYRVPSQNCSSGWPSQEGPAVSSSSESSSDDLASPLCAAQTLHAIISCERIRTQCPNRLLNLAQSVPRGGSLPPWHPRASSTKLEWAGSQLGVAAACYLLWMLWQVPLAKVIAKLMSCWLWTHFVVSAGSYVNDVNFPSCMGSGPHGCIKEQPGERPVLQPHLSLWEMPVIILWHEAQLTSLF